MSLTAEQQALATEYLSTVRGEVWRLYQRVPPSVELDELFGVGQLALTQAVERWPRYCREKRQTTPDDPEAVRFLPAYIKQRVSGALLDYLRSLDWATRTERKIVKALQRAGQDLGPGATLAEQAKAAGVDLASARTALTAAGQRPVPLEEDVTTAEGVTLTPTGFVDEAADTESQAFVRSVLDHVAEVIESLPEITQWVLILRYYEGMSLDAVTQALGRDKDEITRRWRTGILTVHNALLLAATVPGCPCGGACSCGAA